MKMFLILFLLCSLVFADEVKPIEAKELGRIESNQTQNQIIKPIQCEVKLEDSHGWLYAAGGFLAATAIWGLYFYKKNQ